MNLTGSCNKNFSETISLLSKILFVISPLSIFFGVFIVNLNLRQYGFEDFTLPIAKSFAVGFTFIFIHIFFFFVLSRNFEEWKNFYSVLGYLLNFAVNLLAFFSGFILLLSFYILPQQIQHNIANYFFYFVVFVIMLLLSEVNKSLKILNKFYSAIIVFVLIGLTLFIAESFYNHERFFTVFCYFGFLSLIFFIFQSGKNFFFYIEDNFIHRKQEKIVIIISLFVSLLLTLVFYYAKFVYPNFQTALGGGEPSKKISLILKAASKSENKFEVTGQIVHVKSNLYFVKDADENIRIINIDDVEMINMKPLK